MSAASRALLGCVLLACAGCAVQLGGAGHLDAQSGDRGVAVNTTARLQRPRGHGAFGGGHLTFGALGDDGVGLRSLVLTGGNRWAWRGFALEIGIEGGVGQPVVERFDGTGLYAGALASPMLRLSGSTDTDVGFAPGAVLIDLVLTGRFGVWAPPFSDTSGGERFTGSVELGVRFTLVSDLFAAGDDGWVQ